MIPQFLLRVKSIRVKTENITRQFLEDVYFIMRYYASCQAIMENGSAVHKRYEKWCRKSIWNRIFKHFTLGSDNKSIMIDATIIRAHPCAAGYEKGQNECKCLGHSKGGFTTKIHVVVNAL